MGGERELSGLVREYRYTFLLILILILIPIEAFSERRDAQSAV